MNDNEQKVLDWLLLQGIKRKDIIFQSNRSPDFVLKDGRKFEIKTLYNYLNAITFSKEQFDKLQNMNNITIIVFKNGMPIMDFPFEKIDEQDLKYFVWKEKKNRIQFVLDNETNNQLEEIIWISGKSKQGYFEDLVKEIIKNHEVME